METCYYIKHSDFGFIKENNPGRVYMGHETCEKRLPSFNEMKPMLIRLKEHGTALTFITPFLTVNGLSRVKRSIENIVKELNNIEVVTSDWGLLHWLLKNKIAIPITGRLLIGQKTDPRSGLYHLTPELKQHLSSCTLLKRDVILFLNRLGIFRFEISKPILPVNLPSVAGNNYSLHVPFVPITVMKDCLDKDLNFNNVESKCSVKKCAGIFQRWNNPDFETPFYRLDNAIYFTHSNQSDYNITGIDRIVINYRHNLLPPAKY